MGRVESSEAATGNGEVARFGGASPQKAPGKGGVSAWQEGIFPEEYMHFRLREEISRAGRYRHYLSLMMIDFASSGGEQEARSKEERFQYGKQIRSVLRSTDIVFVLDDGKISIILPETTERESQYIMDRLRGDIRSKDPITFGVASYPHDAGHEVSLIQHANQRLSRSLGEGES